MLYIKPCFIAVLFLGVAVSAQRTVMDILQNTPELSNFNQYINSASNARISALLSDPNANVTLFVPVNDAFDKLRQLAPGSNVLSDPQLTNILNFHLIPDQPVMTRDLNDGYQQYRTWYNTNAMSLDRSSRGLIRSASQEVPQDLTSGLIIYARGGNVVIFRGLGSPARIVKPDISASNGVIHEIDQVLVPPLSVWNTLQLRGLTSVMDSIRRANAMDTFQSLSRVTILVPTNEAVAAFLAAHPDITPDALRNVLLNHVIPGYYFSQDLMARPNTSFTMKSGRNIRVSSDQARGLLIGDAAITTPDILAENAVMHVINKVLMPGEVST